MKRICLALAFLALLVLGGCTYSPYYDVVEIEGSPYVINQTTGIIYEVTREDDGSLRVSRVVAEIGRE